MKQQGFKNVPKSTPQSSKQYARLEKLFIEAAHSQKKTPRQLDIEIWEAGSGRTQNTPLPKLK
jgi:thermostable 8-oxoguanine DNA glycosylase